MEVSFSLASLFSAYATLNAAFTLFTQFYTKFVPEFARHYIATKIKQWFGNTVLSEDSFTLVINEYYGEACRTTNLLYDACQVYLSDKLRSKTTRLEGSRTTLKQKSVTYRLAQGESLVETLGKEGIEVYWKFSCKNDQGHDDDLGRNKSIRLSFNLAYKAEVLDDYLPSVVLKNYDNMIARKKEIYMYTYYGGHVHWEPVMFNHPFTFDSLALDPELKQSIIDDLDMFVRRKEFYNKVGRAWKRGYLLYGPPGTGKSSLVAAMANHLRFDIHDLQLGGVDSDSTLRKLMISAKNKSILVIEDIDCTIGLSRAAPKAYGDNEDEAESESDEEYEGQGHQNILNGNANGASRGTRGTKLSLSGLLNFIDGLWSCCGDERIIIFTTNHKEQLDPALLRPGRMDMHINMSYLTMKAFRILVDNYLGVIREHPLFKEIEPLLESLNVTPAEVAEELIRNEDANIALSRVVQMLKKRAADCKDNRKGRETRSNGCHGRKKSHEKIETDSIKDEKDVRAVGLVNGKRKKSVSKNIEQ